MIVDRRTISVQYYLNKVPILERLFKLIKDVKLECINATLTVKFTHAFLQIKMFIIDMFCWKIVLDFNQ